MVVKELKGERCVQEQMQFLEEAQPYRWVALGPLRWRGWALPGRWGRGPADKGAALRPGRASPRPLATPPCPECESRVACWPRAGPAAPATCSSASGPVRRGDALPAGDGVLPNGVQPAPSPCPALLNMDRHPQRGLGLSGSPAPPCGLTSPSKWAQVALHHCLPEVAWGRREVTPPPQRQRPRAGPPWCPGGEGAAASRGSPLLLGVTAIFPRHPAHFGAQSPHAWSSLTILLVFRP